MRWRRAAEPPGFEEALLAVLGATWVIPPDGAGRWVYGLRDAGRVTFYVGKSEHILTRLGAHRKTYGDTLRSVWLVPCDSDWAMTTTEDFLIDRLQPAMNVHGMADEERRIRDRVARRAARARAVNQAREELGLPVGGAAAVQ